MCVYLKKNFLQTTMATAISDLSRHGLGLSAVTEDLRVTRLSLVNDVRMAKEILDKVLQQVTDAHSAAASATSTTTDLLKGFALENRKLRDDRCGVTLQTWRKWPQISCAPFVSCIIESRIEY